jgi:FkbM family methyltransferase
MLSTSLLAARAHRLLVQGAKCVLSAEHRELTRLAKLPRRISFITNLLGVPLRAVDGPSFVSSYKDIFRREIYRFNARGPAPHIIDCGANIGLSVIYFKRLYPASRITAFEADDRVFEVLSDNARSFALDDVTLCNRAVWHEDTDVTFFTEGADAGRVVSPGADGAQLRKVKAVRLRSYLAGETVDLLKIDIEGAETVVLKDCADLLSNVERLFVEYHSFEDRPQTLQDLLSVLSGAGFRVHAETIGVTSQPFVKRQTYLGMDMQMNIFADRAASSL